MKGLNYNPECIKHNVYTRRNECISRRGKQGGMARIKFSRGRLVSTCRAYGQIINLEQPFPDPLWVIFLLNSIHRLSNSIDLEKERISPVYNTVNSPSFPGSMLLSALWTFHCPFSPPQGKRGESQIHPYNLLLVALVKG